MVMLLVVVVRVVRVNAFPTPHQHPLTPFPRDDVFLSLLPLSPIPIRHNSTMKKVCSKNEPVSNTPLGFQRILYQRLQQMCLARESAIYLCRRD